MTVVGVDACTTGWIAVALDRDGHVHAHHLPTIAAVTDAVPDAEVVGIDIPVGLPERGRRAADVAARAALGPRRNSLFFVPPRPALTAATHAAGTAAASALSGVGMSQQAYRLGPKILEVERWLPEAPCPVREVHPELSFAMLLGHPPAAPKKTWAGMVERRAALVRTGIVLDHVGGPAATRAAVDDMLDAAAVAWTARRVRDGLARPFPDPPADGDAVIWA